MSRRMATKYCFVLSCLNNSKSNPDKPFYAVPKNANIRGIWCDAVKRSRESLKHHSTAHCCIDHFNIDDDFEENLDPSKQPKLRAKVVPCIKHLDDSSDVIVPYASYISKSSSNSERSEESDICSSMSAASLHDSDSEWLPTDISTSLDDDDGDDVDDLLCELANQKQRLLLKTELVKSFFGIEFSKMYLVDVIAEEAGISKTHILMCLQKIKQNLSFFVLAFDYALSPGHCARIFQKTILVMAKALEKFIVWSSNEIVEHQLPIAFRANFKEVSSIIDCFEIQIQKPSNAVHQSHTWSQYKECNTIKYLVSSTPDGIVNFISEGFGGRISDLEIVKCSGYLDALPNNSVVMADRGFKSIEAILAKKNCRLIRPPSSSEGGQMAAEDVHFTKQVAALRIHIERVIKRYREFAMLMPHATVSANLVSNLNEVVNIVTALINIQSCFIR